MQFEKIFDYRYNKKNSMYNYIKIPYHEISRKINNVEFRRYIFIDIRNIDENIIFTNFSDFQCTFLSEEFFKNKAKLSCFNIILYFIFDENKKYQFNKQTILRDVNYAIKYFVTIKEAEKFDEIQDITITQANNKFTFNKKEFEFKNFNLIYGPNASGKSRLLKEYSHIYKVPIFYLNIHSDSSKVPTSTKILNDFFLFLNYCNERNFPMLLDVSCWGLLDFRNKIILIDSLFEYSNKNYIAITACQYDIKDLVNLFVFNPNIINLE